MALPRLPRSRYVAAAYWKNKIDEDPLNPRAHRNLAPLLVEQAEVFGVKSVALAALKELKMAVVLNPRNIDSRNDFALALFKLGRIEAAIEELKVGLSIDENHGPIRKNLSAAYARVGKTLL